MSGPPSLARWQELLGQVRDLGAAHAADQHERVSLGAAVGRVLAEPVAALPAGTLLHWRQLPLLVAAGRRTLAVRPRLRAGVVALAGAAEGAAAPLIAGVFEQMGGRALAAGMDEPIHRLGLALEMFAPRCELVFVIGEPGALPVRQRIGALPVSRLANGTLVLFLDPAPRLALSTYVTHAVPLIRRLQGRGDALPGTRLIATTDESTPTGMSLVRERIESGERIVLAACGMTPACLADASGIAWQPPDLADVAAGSRIYLPFAQWLS
ncbi:hypothetical protein [Pelomonas sp. KK5]|uniref:hypothetical protein n=1 Tax=Pelomonas sp. KK5 TaxID=1855730 RepID=UPI00097C130A|nr:hypothetical protein [Pelomonas sp. KK5]